MSWQSGMPDNNFNGHINPNANGNMAPLPPAWALTAADVCFSERCPGDCGKRTHLSLFVPVHVQLNRLQQQQQHQTLHSPTPPQPPQLKQHCGTPRGDRMAPLQHHVGVQIPTPVRVAPSANGNGAWPTPGNGAASGGVNRALQTSTLSCTTDRDSGNESSLTAASNHTPPIDSAQSPGSQQHQVQLGGAASTQLIGHGILASILRTQAGDMGACAPWGGASPGWGGWQHRSHSPAAVSLSSVDLSEESRSRSSSKSSTDMAQLKFSMQHILSRGQPPAAKQPQIAQRGELTDKKTAVAEINSNPKDVPSQSTSAATCRSPPPTPSTSTPLSRHRQLAVSNLNASVASGGGEIVTSVRECSSPRKPVPRTVTLPSMTIPKTTLRSPGNVPNSGSPGCGPTIVQCVAPMPPNAPCVVCTDRASGYHYGVISCEGCKGFFRRTVKKDVVYQCHKSGECPVNRSTRNRCQACRFNKCLRCGMNRDSVRQDQNRKRKARDEQIDAELREIAQLQATISSCLTAFSACVKTACRSAGPINSVDYILAELRSGAAGTRDFAGKLPGFDELCPNDREVLMNSAAVEIVIIRASALPPQTGENSDSKMEPLNTVLRACEQMRHSAEMHELSETDLALLAAVALYSPNCPGIRCPLLVESVQEKYLRALRAQLQSRPHSSDVFANVFVKLVMKLADLRARTTHLNCYFTGRGSQQKAMGPGGDLQTCVGGEMKKEVLSCGGRCVFVDLFALVLEKCQRKWRYPSLVNPYR